MRIIFFHRGAIEARLEQEFITLHDDDKKIMKISPEIEYKDLPDKAVDSLRRRVYSQIVKENEASYLPHRVAIHREDSDDDSDESGGKSPIKKQKRQRGVINDDGDEVSVGCFACGVAQPLNRCRANCDNQYVFVLFWFTFL